MKPILLLTLMTALCGGLVAIGADPAFAQREDDEFWTGSVSGAGNLDQCGYDEDRKALFIQAVESGLSPTGWDKADIQVMSVADYEQWAKDKAKAAGFDPSVAEGVSQDNGFEILANIETRVETYDCKEWTAGKDHDIVVVEYTKSAAKAASDRKIIQGYVEKQQNAPQNGTGYWNGGADTGQQQRQPQNGTGLNGGVVNNWRPDICDRNPQSYQCLYGGPSQNKQQQQPKPKKRVELKPPPRAPQADPNRFIKLPGTNKKDRDPVIAAVDDTFEYCAVTMEDMMVPMTTTLANISQFFAPEYDMTKPHEGYRVAQDMFMDMGLNHLGSEVPGAIRKAVQKHGDRLTEMAVKGADDGAQGLPGVIDNATPAQNTPVKTKAKNTCAGNGDGTPNTPTTPTTRGATQVWRWDNPPPGVEPPDYLFNTYRNYYYQENPNGCTQACIRMMHHTVKGTDLPAGSRKAIFDATSYLPKRPVKFDTGEVMRDAAGNVIYGPSGTYLNDISRLMKHGAGMPNTGFQGGTLEHLAAGTADGVPAMAYVKNSHVVVVDAVVQGPGQRYVYMRDPLYLGEGIDPAVREMFEQTGSNSVIMSETDFNKVFSGKILFPTP